jgi:ribonuclease P protein component
MVMSVLPHPGPARFGIITSRRVGNAVTRNRVRRRLREIVRLNYRRLATDSWLVLIARRAAAEASYRLLEQEWLRLAERTSILKP